ncbi:MAG: hypothetical protein MO852_13950 [Candidatus Devosia euplotis]|nr:hypothetical protein [Candidatus Devosia euplotis]
MEQLAGTVMNNAKKAEIANRQAMAVSQTAEEGGVVIGQTTEAMGRITQSSAEISNIIRLIDISTDQSAGAERLSCELARAGDAEGFA